MLVLAQNYVNHFVGIGVVDTATHHTHLIYVHYSCVCIVKVMCEEHCLGKLWCLCEIEIARGGCCQAVYTDLVCL